MSVEQNIYNQIDKRVLPNLAEEIKKELISQNRKTPRKGQTFSFSRQTRGNLESVSGRRSVAPNPPAEQSKTGLTSQYGYKVLGRGKVEIGNRATSKEGAPYPRFLERGTSKMEARKNFETILKKMTDSGQIKQILHRGGLSKAVLSGIMPKI